MKKRVVCYGDSHTWGYVPGTGERVALKLAAMLNSMK